ncbi:MAG: DUF4301 family protein [Salinimicrobium sp.]
MGLSEKDLSQIEKKGINPAKVQEQIEIFKRGNVAVNVIEAATVRNGILQFSEEEKQRLISLYDGKRDELDILKFIPASGAATRMFKALYNFVRNYNPQEESVNDYVERQNDPKLESFFTRMKDLPFYGEVQKQIHKNHPDFDGLTENKQQLILVRTMLEEEGLNLGEQPKGLVPFHRYEDSSATSFEEHLREAVDYAASKHKVRIHFTVSKEHHEKFEAEARRIKSKLEKETGVTFQISYSYQDPKTDTLAVTKENEPFRDEKGNMFFRPGGHGALINNLNHQDADLIFIKNIDNVVIPKNRQTLAENKKMLAGELLDLQEKTFSCLKKLEGEPTEEELAEMAEFLQKKLNSGLSINFEELQKGEKIEALKKQFNRPIRVCGMVKNEGEPGGGPFWVKHENGEISLQIVESSQIDHDNYQQSKIAQEATHFNPVDVVCAFKNYKGEKFDLQQYVDKDTFFIANKTKDGKDLKALELPGLWNGAMAHWISIFVEVPVETFNPVKTVADLLKPTHQVK